MIILLIKIILIISNNSNYSNNKYQKINFQKKFINQLMKKKN